MLLKIWKGSLMFLKTFINDGTKKGSTVIVLKTFLNDGTRKVT